MNPREHSAHPSRIVSARLDVASERALRMLRTVWETAQPTSLGTPKRSW